MTRKCLSMSTMTYRQVTRTRMAPSQDRRTAPPPYVVDDLHPRWPGQNDEPPG